MKFFNFGTKLGGLAVLGGAVWGLLGCAATPVEIIASSSASAIEIDGKLQEAVWQNTPHYALAHARHQWANSSQGEKDFFRHGVVDRGQFKVLYDQKYLYIGAELYDGDIVSESPQNQTFQHRFGDVIEVFLKPINQTWYWEIHGTPQERHSSFFYAGSGRLSIPGCYAATPVLPGLKIATQLSGSLNNPWDKDVKWSIEIAIPLAELVKFGVKLDDGEPWSMLVARYNFSRYLPVREMSSFPALDFANYHFCEDYGILKLKK